MSTIITSREFNQDVSKAKRATTQGPVFITDRGRTSHVLLSIEAYEKLAGQERSIADLLGMPKAAAIAFEAPRLQDGWLRPADFD